MNYSNSRTFQIYMPDIEENDIKIASLTMGVVTAVEFARNDFKAFTEMEESELPGIYFLFGYDEETDQDVLYIGQSGELRKRISTHTKKKMFWSRAVVCVSSLKNINQTHALLLENMAIKEASLIGRYQMTNGNDGSKPFVTKPMEADCYQLFEQSKALLEVLGHPVFREVSPYKRQEVAISRKAGDIFRMSSFSVEASGTMTKEGFVVLEGAKAPKETSYKADNSAKRQKLIDQGNAKYEDDYFIITKDTIFNTPSGASAILANTSANGWSSWVNDRNKTLDEVYRSE